MEIRGFHSPHSRLLIISLEQLPRVNPSLCQPPADEVLDVHETDGLASGVDDGEFIDAVLVHDGQRFGGEGVDIDVLGVAS